MKYGGLDLPNPGLFWRGFDHYCLGLPWWFYCLPCSREITTTAAILFDIQREIDLSSGIWMEIWISLCQVQGKQFCEINDAPQICCARVHISASLCWYSLEHLSYFSGYKTLLTPQRAWRKKTATVIWWNMILYSGSWNVTTSTGCRIFRL